MDKCFCHFAGYEVKDANARKRVTSVEEQQKVLDSRMNTFTALGEGSTSADAELIDIRAAFNGKTYQSAGSAVREQAAQLFAEMGYYPVSVTMTDGYFANANTGNISENEAYSYTRATLADNVGSVRIENAVFMYGAGVAFYDQANNFLDGLNFSDLGLTGNEGLISVVVNVPKEAKYICASSLPGVQINLFWNIGTWLENTIKKGEKETLMLLNNADITPEEWYRQAISETSGMMSASKIRLRSQRIPYNDAVRYFVSLNDGYSYGVNYYGKNGDFLGYSTWLYSSDHVSSPYENTDHIVFRIRKNDDSEIVESEYKNAVTIFALADGVNILSCALGGVSSVGSITDNVTRMHSSLLIYPHDVYVSLTDPGAYFFEVVVYTSKAGSAVKDGARITWRKNEILVKAGTPFRLNLRANDQAADLSGVAANAAELVRISKEKNDVQVEKIGLDVPEYYFKNDYLQSKISTIETLMRSCAASGDAFFNITDMHWYQNTQKSPALIKYLSEKLPIPRLFNCGDNADGTPYEVMEALRYAFSGDIYTAPGNHEYSWSDQITDNDVFYELNMYNDKAVFGDATRNYFYVDNKKQKIRYIILNAFKEGERHADAVNGYEAEQLAWLRDVALNVESGWTILVFTHALYICRLETDFSLIPSPTNSADVINVVDSYSGNGVIAAIFCGHTHNDRIVRTPGKNIPIIITTADKCLTGTQNVTRQQGTISEQAFDVVVLDKANRKFTLVRIGAPARDGVGVLATDQGVEVEQREVTY